MTERRIVGGGGRGEIEIESDCNKKENQLSDRKEKDNDKWRKK